MSGFFTKALFPVVTNGTVGVTAATALARNDNRTYLEIQNTSANDLWFNFLSADLSTGTAAVNSGFKIAAGGSWNNSVTHCPTNAISVIGSAAGTTYAIITK